MPIYGRARWCDTTREFGLRYSIRYKQITILAFRRTSRQRPQRCWRCSDEPLRPFSKSRRGGAAVEFAITLPLLTFLLLMTFEYAWFYSQRGFVLNAVHDAARYTILQESSQMKAVGEERLQFILTG